MKKEKQTKTNRTKKNAADKASTKQSVAPMAPRASTKSGGAVPAGKLLIKLGADVHERQ